MKRKTDRKPLSDLVLGKLAPEDSLKMLDEIERDPRASKELNTLAELARLGSEGDRVFTEERASLRERLGAKLMKLKEAVGRRRVVLAGACGLLLMGGAVFVADRTARNPYDSLARVHPDDLVSLVRGPMHDDFTNGYLLVVDGNYDGALRSFERFIRAYPRSALVGYAHYSAGVVCLIAARHTILGLAPSYDRERVQQGLVHLGAVSGSGTAPALVEESHFQSAKAFLMLGQVQDAMNELQAVLAMRGDLQTDAMSLMSAIMVLERRN